MPGYAEPVIMSSGAFVAGATIELSCDAPMRAPYEVYLQGGVSAAHGYLGALLAARASDRPRNLASSVPVEAAEIPVEGVALPVAGLDDDPGLLDPGAGNGLTDQRFQTSSQAEGIRLPASRRLPISTRRRSSSMRSFVAIYTDNRPNTA